MTWLCGGGVTEATWALVAEQVLAEQVRFNAWSRQVVNTNREFSTGGIGRTAADVLTGDSRSESFDELLRAAYDFAQSDFLGDEITMDHLFAAMMIRDDLSTFGALRQLDIATEDGVSTLLARINDSDRDAWSALFERISFDSAPFVFDPTVPIEARFEPDSPDADDLMNVEEEAQAFARYIAKRKLETPLAIGLFGDWGSGKSFFMNRMNRFVDELVGNGSSWCGDIVQIEFNAWHYIEGDLWASLVEHILEALEQWSSAEDKNHELGTLFDQFESAQEAKLDTTRKLEEATNEHNDAARRLTSARKALHKVVEHRSSINARALWSAIETQFADNLSDEQKTELEKAAKVLGLPKIASSARELDGVLKQADATRTRARLLASSLLSRDHNILVWLALVLSIAVAPFAAAWAWGVLEDRSLLPEWLGAGVTELSATISVVVGWIATGLSMANKALGRVEKARDTLEGAIKGERTRQDKRLAKAETAIATARERVEQAEGRLAGARQAVDEARRAIEAETPRGRLTRFLNQRLDNEEYAKHLGVVSMIRKDFELLSRIMTDPDWSEENRARLIEANIDPKNLQMFDRIVLYIDDLDRCPAKRVVEVLQAVHLLLAFPLFVVVVGVDARWVSRSLREHYPHLLVDNVSADKATESGNGTGVAGDAELIASSHDYLEKIFQVPYWVKPMDAEASRSFLEGLAARANSVDRQPDQDSAKTATSGSDAERDVIDDSASTSEPPAAGAPELAAEDAGSNIDSSTAADETPSQAADADAQPDSVATRDSALDQTSDDNQAEAADEPAVDPLGPQLTELPLTGFEIRFMKQLAPTVGRSPRRSKRFFNVYQLIRASLTAEERERFVGGRGQALDYRVVMCLLAIVTGSPTLAPLFFRLLLTSPENSGIESLHRYCRNAVIFNSSADWPRLDGVLEVVGYVGPDAELLERLRFWTRRTMRFSFTARPFVEVPADLMVMESDQA